MRASGWVGRVLLTGAAAAVLVVACGDENAQAPVTFPERGDGGASSSSGGSGASSGGSTSSSGGSSRGFCVVLRDLYSEADKCCTGADRDTRTFQYFELVSKLSDAVCVILDASVASGRTKIDTAAQSACVGVLEDYRKTAGCPYGVGLSPLLGIDRANEDCRKVFYGTVTQGGGCKGDHECSAGLTCVGYTLTTDGTCMTPPAIGQPCGAARPDGGGGGSIDLELGNHPECATGAYCSSGKCVAALAPGEPCARHEECDGTKCYQNACGGASAPSASGGPCKNTNDCERGLACHVPTDSVTGTCGAPKPAGQPCSGKATAECRGRCELPDGGGAGTCVTWCGSK